jgi:hypothetical protein
MTQSTCRAVKAAHRCTFHRNIDAQRCSFTRQTYSSRYSGHLPEHGIRFSHAASRATIQRARQVPLWSFALLHRDVTTTIEPSAPTRGRREHGCRPLCNLFFEYTPMWYRERTKFTLETAIKLLEKLVNLQGYTCYLLSEYSTLIAETPLLDIRERLSKDWYTNETAGQTDIYCTRCKHWLQVQENGGQASGLDKKAADEICIEYG